mmetsp:Transcript_38469/g.119689  ORF Transcript_38469/g.119689 Transcript_38469/m.119689 type:complete len:205 (-) Transcript_38469:113-727(-)
MPSTSGRTSKPTTRTPVPGTRPHPVELAEAGMRCTSRSSLPVPSSMSTRQRCSASSRSTRVPCCPFSSGRETTLWTTTRPPFWSPARLAAPGLRAGSLATSGVRHGSRFAPRSRRVTPQLPSRTSQRCSSSSKPRTSPKLPFNVELAGNAAGRPWTHTRLPTPSGGDAGWAPSTASAPVASRFTARKFRVAPSSRRTSQRCSSS